MNNYYAEQIIKYEDIKGYCLQVEQKHAPVTRLIGYKVVPYTDGKISSEELITAYLDIDISWSPQQKVCFIYFFVLYPHSKRDGTLWFALVRLYLCPKIFNFSTKVERCGHLCPLDTFLVVVSLIGIRNGKWLLPFFTDLQYLSVQSLLTDQNVAKINNLRRYIWGDDFFLTLLALMLMVPYSKIWNISHWTVTY